MRLLYWLRLLRFILLVFSRRNRMFVHTLRCMLRLVGYCSMLLMFLLWCFAQNNICYALDYRLASIIHVPTCIRHCFQNPYWHFFRIVCIPMFTLTKQHYSIMPSHSYCYSPVASYYNISNGIRNKNNVCGWRLLASSLSSLHAIWNF